MKGRYILLTIALLSLLSCSEKAEEQEPTKITISVNKTELIADKTDYISIEVTDDLGNDQTGNCQFFANDVLLPNSVFTTSELGNYDLVAKMDDLSSNSMQVSAIERPIQFIQLVADKTEVFADGTDRVMLTVLDDLDNDLTQKATLFANDVEMTGTTYATNDVGVVVFKATLDNFSSTVDVSYKASATMVKRVLIEDYTGTWCGYCPRMASALEVAVARDNRIIPMAIHQGDAMQYQHVNSMLQTFGVTGFPTGMVDRSFRWDETYNHLQTALQEDAHIGLALSTSLDNQSANITVTGKVATSFSTEFKLVVCLTESHLKYDQVNFYNDGRGDPIKNFEHNHVLRKAYTDIYGDDSPAVDADGSFEKVFDVTIPSSIKAANCHVVAMVVYKANNKVINVQQVKLGEITGY